MATILVVDDEPDILLLTRLNLERDGHTIVTAANGAEALAAVQDAPPDLIVLDVMMPEVDGWGVLDQLKSKLDKSLSEIPVILLTALGSPTDRAKGAIEGAVRHLTKPIDLDELRTAVTTALSEPELPQRRKAQQHALETLARMERSATAGERLDAPRPRLSGLEREREAPRPSGRRVPTITAEQLASLTTKQRQLLEVVAAAPTVMQASSSLEMSRSNIYASLRRISRKLGVRSVTELLDVARAGLLAPSD